MERYFVNGVEFNLDGFKAMICGSIERNESLQDVLNDLIIGEGRDIGGDWFEVM